jgi:hypothetical protein
MKFHRIMAVIAGLFIILQIESVSAQSFVMQNRAEEKPRIGLRFMRPNFSGDAGLSTFSGAYDFHVNIPVSARLNFAGSVPFNTASGEDVDGESSIGDIYLGIQTRSASADKGASVSFGVFLPTASEEKFLPLIVGLSTNFYELHRSLPDVLTIYTNFDYHNRQTNGPMFGLEIGPQLYIPTEDGGDTELFAHYGVSGGVQLTNVALSAELLGIVVITEDYENFGDRFTHFIDFGAQLTGYSVKPGIFYSIPLDDDFRDDLDGVLGVKVDFALP